MILLIFNRPAHTQRVFECVRRVQPSKLFIVADGPRTMQELALCESARRIATSVDWDCQVETNFSDENLGCQTRVSSGLSWAFERSDDAIILEDDCVPDPSFFNFCSDLLDRYRDDERVMAISGNNFQFGKSRGAASYYFSLYPHCWGWATWSRAWQHYDGTMQQWQELRQSRWLQHVLGDRRAVRYWERVFDRTFRGDVNSWAYRWLFSCWTHNGVTALPNCNLVSNVGFGELATHCRNDSPMMALQTAPLKFPLAHPPDVCPDRVADRLTYDLCFRELTRFQLWLHRVTHPVKTARNVVRKMQK